MHKHGICMACEAGVCDSQIDFDEPTIEINRRFKGCSILLQKDKPNGNWYLIVHTKDGGYLYDGYWQDSADKTEAEAFMEAKFGAGLIKKDV